jgi:hypothetical protein
VLFGGGMGDDALMGGMGGGSLGDLLPLMGASGADAGAADLLPLLFMG